MKKSLLIFGGKSTAIEIRESAMLYPKLIFDNILLVIPDDEIIDKQLYLMPYIIQNLTTTISEFEKKYSENDKPEKSKIILIFLICFLMCICCCLVNCEKVCIILVYIYIFLKNYLLS